jgi:hypothetical protein
MNKLLFIFLLINVNSWANCPNPINSSKIILFVDTNQSELEIATAQKAACQRGEKLMVVPKNYKEYGKFIAVEQKAYRDKKQCFETTRDFSSCENFTKKHHEAMNALEEFKSKQPTISNNVEEALKEIKSNKAKIVSFNISGHDGGGHYGGSKGTFSRLQLAEIMSDFPEINEVESLLLLGCYTGVQREVSEWKMIFPKTKMIGGYDGSAPLSHRPQGHAYLEDLLTKEKQLLKINKSEEVDLQVKSLIKGLDQLHAAIYLKPECSQKDDNSYYYGSKLDRIFTAYEPDQCEVAGTELGPLIGRIRKFESGENEPSRERSQEIRQIYNTVRTHEHCIPSLGLPLNANHVFNLLFYEDIKKNFAHYFEEDLKEAETIVSSINMEEIINGQMEELKKSIEHLEQKQVDYDLFNKDPKKYLKKEQESLKSLQEEFQVINSELQSLNKSYLELSEDERKKANQSNELQFKILNKQNDLRILEQMPAYFKDLKLNDINASSGEIARRQHVIDDLKKDSDQFKNIWVPGAKNLEKKSRKELLDNQHQLHRLMMMGGINGKVMGALAWVSMITANHLVSFHNPFSWHEYTGHPEPVSIPTKLASTIQVYEQGMKGGGFFGGYSPSFSLRRESGIGR